MLSDTTLAFGGEIMTALLGVDALYRRESGDEVGLAVLNMDVEGRYAPDAFGGYGDARLRFEDLREATATLPEEDRRVYYEDVCLSTLAFLRWRQAGLPFRSQLAEFLHVPPEPPEPENLASTRRVIGMLLTGMGYKGDVQKQCAAWEERNRVPPDDVPEVLTALLDEAWDRTEEHLLEIPAPKSDGMKVAAVSGVAYNARCDYLNRTIELNVDPVLTRPALKHLAVHEGYPGHYLQFKLRETMAREGTAAPDVLLSVVNTASSSVFEGIADNGMRSIGWLDSPDDHVQELMNIYRAGIAAGAAWRLHALGWTPSETTEWLRRQTLVGGEGWVANRMAFISAPSRAVLIWSYWWGEQLVANAWGGFEEERKTDFLRYLYGRLHSPESVGMFTDGPSMRWVS